jgi:hypothetical protein
MWSEIRVGAAVRERRTRTVKGQDVGSLLAAWPTRRRVAVAILLPLVATWFVAVGGSTDSALSAGWYAVAILAAALGAGVLATYVPAAGRTPDLGCTPCAAMSAFTVVGATLLLRSYGPDVTGPLLASAVLLFGLVQRMSQPTACAAVPPDRVGLREAGAAASPAPDGAAERR